MPGQKTVADLQAPLALHCVVIGAGAIGLASAIALARVGHNVVLLEQAPDLDHVHSAGFAIPPNLTKTLYKWGLRKPLEAITTCWRRVSFEQYFDGEHYSQHAWDEEALAECGGDWRFTEFTVFHRFLVETAQLCGVDIRTGAQVTSVAADGTSVSLANGQTVPAEVVVAAGGLDDIVRAELLDQEDVEAAKPCALRNFNVHVPGEKMRADSELRALWENDTTCTMWWGTRFVIGFRKGHTDEYVLEVLTKYTEGVDVSNHWQSPYPSEELRALMGSCEPRLAKLVELGACYGGEQIVHHPLLEDWVHPSGRAVVVGNAAHPTILGAGAIQGAAMGFEDAASLARLLARVSRHDQIPVLLHGFRAVRQPRAAPIMSYEVKHSPFCALPAHPSTFASVATPERPSVPLASGVIAAQMRAHYEASLRMLGWDLSGVALWRAVGSLWAYDAEDAADDWWVEWVAPAERARMGNAMGLTVVDLVVEVVKAQGVEA